MIEVNGLTKRFGRTVAVDGLSFTARPGRVTGFLGPNGAGKSTTMRMLLGLDRPDAGTARIAGRAFAELSHPLRTVGALLDARWVHPRHTARRHLTWLARSGGVAPARVDEVLDLVGLTGAADRRAGGFSLGMAQRLGLAAALLGDPEVLVLDEPVNGLDPDGIASVRGLLHRFAGEGRTVLVSSHLLAEMALTATDLVVVGRGRLVAQTGVEALLAQAGGGAVRVRSPQAERLGTLLRAAGHTVREDPARPGALLVDGGPEPVGELAAAHGLVLHELAAERTTLEHAFLRLTAGVTDHTGSAPAELAEVLR